MAIRFISYLTPSLPEGLYECVAAYLGRALGLRTSVHFELRVSAPVEGASDPFSTGEADVGFMCAPGYLRLEQRGAVRLVHAAPVFDDPRAHEQPVYFSDVVVRRGTGITSFDELRGRSWAFNDVCSLSGYLCLVRRLGGAAMRAQARPSGSHLESVRLVARGDVDAAAVDSNVLALLLRREPELARRITVVESLGPHPIQPIVASSSIPAGVVDRLGVALRAMHEDPSSAARLRSFGVVRFAAVHGEHYASERAALQTWRSDRAAAPGASSS